MSHPPGKLILMPPADLLDFEQAWPRHTGAKEEAIIRQLGMKPARYYLLLDRALDTREALEADPMLVLRLRRIRDARRAERDRRLAG